MCEQTITFDNLRRPDAIIYSLTETGRTEISRLPGYGKETISWKGSNVKLHVIFIGCCEWVKEVELDECETIIKL